MNEEHLTAEEERDIARLRAILAKYGFYPTRIWPKRLDDASPPEIPPKPTRPCPPKPTRLCKRCNEQIQPSYHFCDACRRLKRRAKDVARRERLKAEGKKLSYYPENNARWYAENRKNNPEWIEKNKARAKAWRARRNRGQHSSKED